MSGFETLDVDVYLSSLKDDTILKSLFPGGNVLINADFGPKDNPDLYIVFSMETDHDTNTLGGNRAFTNPSYQIEANGHEIGFNVLRPIMERIDAIVTDPNSMRLIGTTFVGRFIRTNIIKHSTSLDNIRWHSLAGVYDLIAYTYNVP